MNCWNFWIPIRHKKGERSFAFPFKTFAFQLLIQCAQRLIEFRVRDIDTPAVLYCGRSRSSKSGDGKCHCDAVIQIAVDVRAVERISTVDDHAVFGRNHVCAHGKQSFRCCFDPVGLLHFEFSGIFDHSCSFCESCHYSDHWNLVNESRDDRTFYRRTVK